MMKFFHSIFFVLISKVIFCQNLVYNGGFETIERCPDNYGQINLATGWYSIFSTPDLYNKCSFFEGNPLYSCVLKKAILTNQKPKTGNGCAGFLAGEYETIQTKLSQRLKKGKQYKVEFYLRTVKGSECVLTPIFGLLTKYSTLDSIYKYENFNNQVCTKDYKALLDTTWVKVDGIYTSTGEEKYFSIAYVNLENKMFCLCYYSVDDISVCPLITENMISQEFANKDSFNYKQGDVFILKNVNFEFDKSELLSDSYETLDGLIDYLQKNESIIISINGYTDNIGTEMHNIELSKERARAVYDYLVEQGINKDRMRYEGFGSSKPLIDNSTEENRKTNRRVEIKIEKGK